MIISLKNNHPSSGTNGTSATFVHSRTPPIYKMLFFFGLISFAVPEAMLILNNDWIILANARKVRSIDQDIRFSKDNIFNVPILVLCNQMKIQFYSKLFELFVFVDVMIMLISLHNDGFSPGFDGTFAAMVNFGTFPILNMCGMPSIMRFAVLESMLILHNNWISHADTRKQGSIDQDFVFFENIIFRRPVVLWKNKRISKFCIQNFL